MAGFLGGGSSSLLPCQAGLWSSRTAALATLLRGWRAGLGIPWAGQSRLQLLSMLLSSDPGAQNEGPKDTRQRMRSSQWLGHAGTSPRPPHLVLLPIQCGWHYLLFQAIRREQLHSKLHRSPLKPNMPCVNCEARSWLPRSWARRPVLLVGVVCSAETWGSAGSGDCVHISASPLLLCDIRQLI